jgi:hypothetical protein
MIVGMGGTEAASQGTSALTVPLAAPSAQLLADQAGIVADLRFVMECCKKLLAELDKPEIVRDPVVPEALWSAALVAYARCFGKGKRFGLEAEDVRSLPLQGEVMTFHQWVLAERDRLTRHPANPFDAAKVGAALSPPDQDNRRVQGIVILSASHLLVDDTGVRQLGGLASELAKQTADKAQKQQDAVLADAQQASIDSLYKLTPLRTGPPPAEDA